MPAPDIILRVGEKRYPLSWEDITVGRLRQVKAWFPDLGSYLKLVTGIQMLDPEAALAAVWIARKASGEANPPDPNQMEDFPLNLFLEAVPEVEEEPEEVDPTTEKPTVDPTPSSTKTRRKSTDGTSD